MKQETRKCQNCKKEFVIEPEDFDFYKKIDVPPPTFCPDCRLQRRMAFRNERTMYKRRCNAPGHSEEIISIFSPDKEDTVYDQAAWWSDSWDPLSYGRDYNFSKTFFDQLHELWKQVPDIALVNNKCVNSEYCSITEENKNCYLVVGGDFNENTLYSSFIFHSNECMDCYWVSKSEFNYETVDCIKCSRLLYSRYCEECYDSAFLFNCRNCNNCFGCTNLVSKSYCIFNEQYSKEEYKKRLKEINMGSWAAIQDVKKQHILDSFKYPRRYARILRSVNSVGDNLEECKNCKYAFEVFNGAEDSRYLWLIYSPVKDCYDCDHSGLNTEKCCDSSTIYPGSKNLYCRLMRSCRDVCYSYNCHNCSNCFGCVGLRDKQYCILNKQYSKGGYEALVPKIIEHMKEVPYVDAKGRVYKYGEFFPPEISPFCYNETVAQELFPFTKREAIEQGYKWKDPERKTHTLTLLVDEIPDVISDVSDSITQETIECSHKGECAEQCTGAFRIIPRELKFYRHMDIPIPRLCPNCRHYQRLKQRNPLKLWYRKCQCVGTKSDGGVYKNAVTHGHHGENRCLNEFETTYAPDRKEIVYCEKCYQAEVV